MKSFLFAILFIGFLMASCTTDLSTGEENSIPDVEGIDTKFIAIRLAAPLDVKGRSDSDKNWGFQQGNENENKISSVRFYFFDDDDKIVKLKNASSNNTSDFSNYYYLNNPTDKTNPTDNNVEKIVSALLCVEFEKGKVPTKVIAIVNPCSYLDQIENEKEFYDFSLSDLQNIVNDFKYIEEFDTNLTEKGNFIMSNSTYVLALNKDEESDANIQSIVCPVALSRSNICISESEALQPENTVTIYVERVLARVDITFKKDENTQPGYQENFHVGMENVYATGVKYSPDDSGGEEKEIYVQFLGWAVTSTPKTSRLLKKVDSTWDKDKFFSSGISWNGQNGGDKDFYRSFWAVNPPLENEQEKYNDYYNWFSYSDLTEIDSSKRKRDCLEVDITNTTTTYMQENANPFNLVNDRISPLNPTYPTKVIFAGKLVNSDGEAVTIAEYDSKQYRLNDLKQLIASGLDLYRLARNDETGYEINNKYIRIQPSDIDFETAKEHGKDFSPDAEGMYYVYFTVKKPAKNGDEADTEENKINWYHKSDLSENVDESKALTEEALKKYIDDMTFPAKVWNEGRTYYFFDILHCQEIRKEDPGYYGVVRNTLYNATIEEIKTLGTPVYNPDEIIYPENPPSSGNHMIVEIETFQWRLINQNLQLTW